MTTEANPRILNRSQARVDAKELIESASPLLEEIINYSTQAFLRCCLTGNSTDKELAPFVLYFHIVEMTDGVQVLIAQSCCEPVAPLIRSCFEGFLSLEYLLKDDYERRCLCWLYFDYLRSTQKFEQLDPESDRGKGFYEVFAREMPSVTVPRWPAEHLGNIRKISPNPRLTPIKEEFKRTKKKCKTPEWYTLFDGPRNLRELARSLSMEGEYITLYKESSSVIHAGDSSRYIETLPDGTVVGRQLRLAENLINYAFYAGVFLWRATDSMLRKFRPYEPNHAKWSTDIRSRLIQMRGINIEVLHRRA